MPRNKEGSVALLFFSFLNLSRQFLPPAVIVMLSLLSLSRRSSSLSMATPITGRGVFAFIVQRQQHHHVPQPAFSSTTRLFSSNSRSTETNDFSCSRLGLNPMENRRHCPLVYHEHYSFDDWPEHHTFPMDKFARLARALTDCNDTTDIDTTCNTTNTAPVPLVEDYQHFFRPLDYNPENWPLLQSWLYTCGPLDKRFVDRFVNAEFTEEEARRIGFREQMYRPELIQRTILEVAGTVLTAQLACHYGIAANLAGGTHHACHNMGSGYTILNDLVVTAHYLLTNHNSESWMYGHDSNNSRMTMKIERVLVVDCDVHQGDGTAKCMEQVGRDKLFTLSLHCASNYPHPKAHSTYDIGLPDKMQDDAYLQTLQEALDRALEEVQPDFVLYDAGVDIYEHDKLGRLKITEEGIRKRDNLVLSRCVDLEIPVAGVIGGGYDRDVDALARRHGILHEECSRIWRERKMWKQDLSILSI